MNDGVVRIGVLTPHVAAGPEVEFAAMAPGRSVTTVARVSTEIAAVGVTSGPPPPDAARALTAAPLLDGAADTLAAASVDVIGYASTSSAYAIGFDDEVAIAARLSHRTGIPVATTCASAVMALRVLDVDRIALVSPPWFDDEVNRLGAAYFRSQGVEVVSSESADLPRDPRRIETAEVIEWVFSHAPDDAGALWLAGNGFRTAAAVEMLEDTLGRPVLTANQVLLWALLAQADASFEVSGYGRLFARVPVTE
ncbi:MAG: maleate cis-trans isomerase family protein [Nocardioidaceae bacterium]